MIAKGGRVIAGSDFPVETLSPLWGLQRLVTGADVGGDAVAPSLGRAEALAAMTDESAGTVTLERDPRAVAPHEIHAIEVIATEPLG